MTTKQSNESTVEEMFRAYSELTPQLIQASNELAAQDSTEATAAADYWGEWIGGLVVIGLTVVLDMTMTFHNGGDYKIRVKGSLTGVGLSACGGAGTVRFTRDPRTLIGNTLYCSLFVSPPLPFVPPYLTADFSYDPIGWIGKAEGPVLGIHALVIAKGDVGVNQA